jgi:DNA modification methylase
VNYQILHGDVIQMLKTLADSSVDSVVTDPPYELSFMQAKWDGTGIAYNVEMWHECLRVLKPGGHLLSFGGTRTYHRMTCAVEDAGFQVRDQIGWVFGSGFPKSHNLHGDYEGWGTALKPAWEPVCLARKPFEGTVADNTATHGTGALNIAACRVPGESVPINKLEKWSGFGQEKQPNYTATMSDVGRWPANLIHDGSEEVLAAFPEAPGQQADVKYSDESKTKSIYGAMKRGNEPSANSSNDGSVGFKMKPGARRLDEGSAARFFYCAKAGKEDRNEGCENIEAKRYSHDGRETPIDNAYQRNSSNSSNSSNSHPTVKPTALMSYLCKLITPPGGTVLDCFMGSGSTGKAALKEGYNFIGIDQDEHYCAIAKARMDHILETDMPLFREVV